MPLRSISRTADDTISALANYGLAGAILAAMVAPVLFFLVRGVHARASADQVAQQREQEIRTQREERLMAKLFEHSDAMVKMLTELAHTKLEMAQALADATRTLERISERLER